MVEQFQNFSFENMPLRTFVYYRATYTKEEHEKSLCWRYLDRRESIDIIFERIKLDIEEFEKINNQLFSILEAKKNSVELTEKSDKYFQILRLDIESLFIYIRALMDDTCKLIKYWVGDVKFKIPNSMNKLLFESKFNQVRENEPVFFDELKENLHWLETFIDDRNDLIHKLKQICIIVKSEGTFFDVKHPRLQTKETEKNVINFVQGVRKKLKNLDSFLIENMKYIYNRNRI